MLVVAACSRPSAAAPETEKELSANRITLLPSRCPLPLAPDEPHLMGVHGRFLGGSKKHLDPTVAGETAKSLLTWDERPPASPSTPAPPAPPAEVTEPSAG